MRNLPWKVLWLVALAGCSDGGGGDGPPEVKGSVLGNGRTLASLNDPKNPRPSLNESVAITGVQVVHIDSFDETQEGLTGNIFLRDFTTKPGPFEGIIAFNSSYSPPSFRTSKGDVLDATGQYTEFQLAFVADTRPGWTTPEIIANLELRFDAPYVEPVPVEINKEDLLDYSTGRQWLSMLVTVRNVKLLNDVTSGAGRKNPSFFVKEGVAANLNPQVTNELFDLAGYAAFAKSKLGTDTLEGVEFESVTGIVTLFDRFHIAPRSADDLKLK